MTESNAEGPSWARAHAKLLDAIVDSEKAAGSLRHYALGNGLKATIRIAFQRVLGPGIIESARNPNGTLFPMVRTEVRNRGGQLVDMAKLSGEDFAELAGLVSAFEAWLKGNVIELPKEY